MKQKGNLVLLGLGLRLRQVRVARGYNQSRAAKLYGISRASLNNWESGDVSPTLANLNWVCQKLGIEPDLMEFGGARYERFLEGIRAADVSKPANRLAAIARTATADPAPQPVAEKAKAQTAAANRAVRQKNETSDERFMRLFRKGSDLEKSRAPVNVPVGVQDFDAE